MLRSLFIIIIIVIIIIAIIVVVVVVVPSAINCFLYPLRAGPFLGPEVLDGQKSFILSCTQIPRGSSFAVR